MPRRRSSQPTEVELEILNVLWEHGPCPMGTIHEVLCAERERGYTTTQKMVQVARDKGLVVCDDSVHPPLYRPAETRQEVQLSMLDDLAQRAFGGSAQKLVMRLVSTERISLDELRQIQRLVREAKGGK